MNKILYFIKYILPIKICLIGGMCYSQNPDFKNIEQLIQKNKNFEAIKILENIDQKKISKYNSARIYYYLARTYDNENISGKAFENYQKSEEIYSKIGDISNAMEVKLEMAVTLSSENLSYEGAKKYVTDYINFAKASKNHNLISKGYYRWATLIMDDEPLESKKYFLRAIEENKMTNNEKAYSDIIFNLASLYDVKLNQKDSAYHYYNESLKIAKKKNYVDDICMCLMNMAKIYSDQKNYIKAITLLNNADKLPITQYTKNIKSRIHDYLSANYAKIGDKNKAYEELRNSVKLVDNNFSEEQNRTINELQTRYESKKKQVENLNLKIKNRNNQLLLYLIVCILIVSFFLGYLRINFLNKKKKIAEQEKLIESQKLENVLKEQELKEIDKLLEGQEKERIKIANDLHDNLGSLMATLKLNFQNLKLKSNSSPEEHEQLFDKTDDLLEEAYQKVRGIAHAKNAGVIANEGLLPAIINIAKKVTIAGKLEVQVIPFGLDEKLENTLEVTIFRMVQELLTNTIKHADASKITIHLTQHHDSLNIIIEDNGKGFNSKNIDKKEGMGLPNIEKKVEQMGGTFTIDSVLGNGTSIIIDLPL